MVRLQFIDPLAQEILFEFINPPVLPNTGDYTEAPDGRIFQIVNRWYSVSKPASNILSLDNKSLDPTVDIKCVIVEVKEDRYAKQN